LAATRLALSGQVFEVYPLLRTAIEHAWYALHLAKDPHPPTRFNTWLSRQDSDETMNRCKAEFTVARVKATHAALDPDTARIFHGLYKDTIEMGAHPNERGVLSTMHRTDEGDRTYFEVLVLAGKKPDLIEEALRKGVEVAIGVLLTARLVSPERYAEARMDEEIPRLVRAAGAAFKAIPRVDAGPV
jgi:hypothetical protein